MFNTFTNKTVISIILLFFFSVTAKAETKYYGERWNILKNIEGSQEYIKLVSEGKISEAKDFASISVLDLQKINGVELPVYVFGSLPNRSATTNLTVYKYVFEELKLSPNFIYNGKFPSYVDICRQHYRRPLNATVFIDLLIKAGLNDTKILSQMFINCISSRYRSRNIDDTLIMSLYKKLVQAGASPLYRDRNGTTMLMHAVNSRHIPLIKEIIKAGADVNAFDYRGRNAGSYFQNIYDPKKEKEREIAQILIDAGIASYTRKSWLKFAIRRRYKDLARHVKSTLKN